MHLKTKTSVLASPSFPNVFPLFSPIEHYPDCDVTFSSSFLSTGGKYLTIPEVSDKKSGRGARLVLPLTPPWNDGNLCLSFRHKLAGHHVGMLQVFVKKGKQYSPAVWGRTGGSGWRHTQITLWGTGLESVSIQ